MEEEGKFIPSHASLSTEQRNLRTKTYIRCNRPKIKSKVYFISRSLPKIVFSFASNCLQFFFCRPCPLKNNLAIFALLRNDSSLVIKIFLILAGLKNFLLYISSHARFTKSVMQELFSCS